MSSRVHPQAQLILDALAAAGRPPFWELTPEQARAIVTANSEHIGPGPGLASVRDVVIPGQAGGIPARVYSPAAGAPGVTG